MGVMEVVLAIQQVIDFRVEDLPSEMLRLAHDGSPELGVGVVAEVLPLVDEALAVGVEHHAQEIADLAVVLALKVREIEIAEVGRAPIHRSRMTAPEEPVRLRADAERHLETLPQVVRRAAHPRQLPAFAQVACPERGVRLVAAAGKNNGVRAHFSSRPVGIADPDADHSAIFHDQAHGGAAEADFAAPGAKRLMFGLNETEAFVPSGQRQAAPEHEPAVFLERLTGIDWLEEDAMRSEPAHGVVAVVDKRALLRTQWATVVEA